MVGCVLGQSINPFKPEISMEISILKPLVEGK